MLEVTRIYFIETESSDFIRRGRVVVEYSDGEVATFPMVPRSQFFRWQRSDWDDDERPDRVVMRDELYDDEDDEGS